MIADRLRYLITPAFRILGPAGFVVLLLIRVVEIRAKDGREVIVFHHRRLNTADALKYASRQRGVFGGARRLRGSSLDLLRERIKIATGLNVPCAGTRKSSRNRVPCFLRSRHFPCMTISGMPID